MNTVSPDPAGAPTPASSEGRGPRTPPRPVLALDIGGTKIAAAVVDPGGRIVRALRQPTPEDPWPTVVALLEEMGEDEYAGIGVGCGGPMTWPAGEVSPLNIPAWRDFPLRERLRERHPVVRVHNDAVCVVIGEHWRGAGRGRDNVLGMVVSTGVGGGLVLGGRLVDGASGNAGHIGHVVVDPEGPDCVCGGRGCLEAVARGPALVAWARELGWHGTTGKELADDAARGHDVALRAMRRAGEALGVAIASAAHLLDVEVVAVGGGLAQAGPLLFDPLEQAFGRHAGLDFAREVRVVAAALGQDAGLIGAAALVHAGDRYWSGG